MELQLNGAWTLAIALATILLGRALNQWFPPLARGNIPPAVSAGLLMSLALSGLRAGGWLDVRFAARHATCCCWCSSPCWASARTSAACCRPARTRW